MKPRIVVLSAFLTPFRSGAEACSEEIPLKLKDQYDFTVVTVRGKRSLPKRDLLQGEIPILRVGFGLGVGFDKWLFPFLAPFAVYTIKPDVVHAILETFAGLALVFCKWFVPSPRRLLTLQTTNRSFLKGFVLRSPDKVTAISSVLKDIAEKLGRDDVTVIPNGISAAEIHEFRLRHEKVPGRILFVGRLREMKGVDTLLRAFAGLDATAHLRIVGEGYLRRSLEVLSRELGIADRVTFLGYIPVPDVYEEFAKAEIFCSLSRHEALGNVFLEAQAAGCVVLGTTVEGIPEIVEDGKTGLLVSPNDIDAAVEALRKLVSDRHLRSRLQHAAVENAKKYDWKSIAERYADQYNYLLSLTNWAARNKLSNVPASTHSFSRRV